MKIVIIGGGNIGTQLAVHCSQKNETYIYTSTPDVFVPDIQIVDEHDKIFLAGKNIRATSDPKTAFIDADYIFITYPAFMLNDIAKTLLPLYGKSEDDPKYIELLNNYKNTVSKQNLPIPEDILEKNRSNEL